jgi:hypothetical protein
MKSGPQTQRRVPIWLWLSVPIAILAMAGSVVGIAFEDRIYGQETANWAAQSVGQDIANLVAYAVLLLLALLAGRGSVRAYLAWTGVLVYSVYTYAIYVFDIHFGPLFLVWLAVFGLSVYALIGAVANVDPERVRATLTGRAPVRSTGGVLIGIGAAFALLWLSEIIPPLFSGTVPQAVAEAGVPTNPVHVLDLALFLPGAILAGVLLTRRRAWGYVLAPTILVAMIMLALGIVSLMVVLSVRGEASSLGVGVGIGVLALVELLVVVRFLWGIHGEAGLGDVLRRPDG